ncbi:MAG: BON domain-containing protein [Chloracidobacterium sp.]|nr:BON domain-containing protein [Chloracidobacterium sp.]
MIFALIMSIAPITPGAPSPDGKDATAIRKIRKELVTLPFYGVFDNLAFKYEEGVVTLYGQVSRPTLKKDAARVVERVAGVDQVVNKIEVLPLSNFDDRIRIAVYRAIYRQPGLDRLSLQAVPPIHIIVKNGNVALEGVVANNGDATRAFIAANGAPGVFSVKNDLQIEKNN